MKKLLQLTTVITLLFLTGCSNEENETILDQANVSVDLASDDFANSNMGIYNGVFTSIDGQTRGSLKIQLPADERSLPTAEVQFSNGQFIEMISNEIVRFNTSIDNLHFSNSGITFNFSVEANGNNPRVSQVIINDQDGSALIGKHTNRAPVTPIPGSFACTDCGMHPVLGTGAEQSFNLLTFTDPDGNSTFETEVSLGMNTFNGTGSQSNCVANGVETTCDISGTFSVSGAPITWSGTHTFNNEMSGASDCSGTSGTWSFASSNFGTLTGTFESDNTCSSQPTQLVFEDFEDATITYVTNIPEFTDGSGDFFIRTDGSNIGGFYSIQNVQGTSWFAIMDTNGEPPFAEVVDLTWSNINVSGLTTLTFSALFAEDDDGVNQDWDGGDFVNVEVSFDGGVNWTPIISFANITGGTNAEPAQDTDFDGIGDGMPLTDILTSFTADINTNGNNTISLRILANDLDQGDVDISFDNVLLTGI